jgi:exopolyphosphatase/guanosine-5'-triphosphate,3'-diphosphate pyrophosphatase
MATDDRSAEVAAVDLGSNSFHMVVAREQGAELQVLDRLREPVRLAAGLDEEKQLSADAQRRALECLERFGQRLAGIPRDRVRVVGTKTLRKLKNWCW